MSDDGRIRHNVVSTAMAIGIALLVRAMLFETYYVPSESMLPTLLIGDHMLVNKYAFGARIPFTNFRLPALREPVRG
ncbi:MAG: signal peptidase I, partial [Deltaproteobacteria bacterium]|nr:signal peptidase I [Deltaproteobacteria bacterium]